VHSLAVTAAIIVAWLALLSAAAPIYFFVFWTWFEFWRRHRVLTFTMMAATFLGVTIGIVVLHRWVFGYALAMPTWGRWIGAGLLVLSTVFGTIADRQIGFRVRSFTPFFEHAEKIELRTTGAYGVVRHPIYSSGIFFQLGAFLWSGLPSVLLACVFFGLGASWFSAQEERRLVALLDDPSEYDRYRERVPKLIPRLFR
jgi:protein-S-isoprenylcysteine O-methyltransferase Ste14